MWNYDILGKPKGVILSHENIVACTSACAKQLGVNSPNKNDIMISYLPMAHMLERICQVEKYFLTTLLILILPAKKKVESVSHLC
jgi:long-subunit acyl-CoA synthetase (AMP-forming)